MREFEAMRMNPDYPYLDSQLAVRKWEAEIWLKVARERGKLDHPAAVVMRENLALIERISNERAA